MQAELFLDTSTPQGLLALRLVTGEVIERLIPAGAHSSHALLPSIQDLLQEKQIELKNLSRILCGIGPGSYTGIRVAVTIASSLAFGLDRAWAGLPSLLLWPPQQPGRFFALLDARSGGVYALAAEWNGEQGTILLAPQRLSIEDFLKQSHHLNIHHLVTPDLEKIQRRVPSSFSIEAAAPSSRWIWKAPASLQQSTVHYG